MLKHIFGRETALPPFSKANDGCAVKEKIGYNGLVTKDDFTDACHLFQNHYKFKRRFVMAKCREVIMVILGN